MTKGASFLTVLGALACSTRSVDPPPSPRGEAGSGGAATGGAAGATAGTGGAETFSWSVAEPCPEPRFEANGVVVDGELWVMGGFTASSLTVTRRIDEYDPASNDWRRGLDLPGAETHIAAVVHEGDVIVAGGFSGAFTNNRPPPTAQVFRLPNGELSWVEGPALPDAGAGFAWALLGSELHLAAGLFADGNSDSPYHYAWDIEGDATWTSAAEVMNPRNHGGGAVAGGIFYAIAGRHGWDERNGNVADVEAFDPESGTWASRAPLPVGRSEIGASTFTMSDGRILVIGGSVNGIMPSDDVYVYDPESDEWTTLPKLPEKRKGAVAAQIGELIVVTTGSPTSTDPIDTTFVGCCL